MGRPRRARGKDEAAGLREMFPHIDADTVAAVLAAHGGEVELAAASLFEFAVPTDAAPAPEPAAPAAASKSADSAKGSQADMAFWADVVKDTVGTSNPESDPGAACSRALPAKSTLRGVLAKMAALPPAQELEGGALQAAEVERFVGWRPGDGDVEVLVKWKGRGHVHASWVSHHAVQATNHPQLKQRLKRFLAEHDGCRDVNLAVTEDLVRVERLVAADDSNAGAGRHLVKWQGLTYQDCTWESLEEMRAWELPGLDKALEAYTAVAARAAARAAAAVGSDPPREMQEAAAVRALYGTGNVLRHYQTAGVEWLAFNYSEGRSSILADEMGLGKTAQTIAFLDYLWRRQPGAIALVVVPLSVLVNWQRELARWAPHANVVSYVGNAEARRVIREHEFLVDRADEGRGYRMDVLLTTYEMAGVDKALITKIPFATLVVDEGHRLKKGDGKLASDLRSFRVPHAVVLTGTPLQNNMHELWSLLNFLDPAHFDSADAFLARFGDMQEARQVSGLLSTLRPYLLRRLKTDVEQRLPPRVETLVECEMAPLQKKVYRALFEKNFQFLQSGVSAKTFGNFTNLFMELRKTCNHPYLIAGVEAAAAAGGAGVDHLVETAGKLQLLDKLLEKLKAEGHKVLIFSQMTRVLDILEDYCHGRQFAYERLDGNVSGADRQAAIDRFCHAESDRFCFLLSTRAGGVGINLVAADTCIIFDSDWNPQNDAQALARCHRIGQTRPVSVYRLLMAGTYERKMLDSASRKLGLERAIFGGLDDGDNLNAGAGANASANGASKDGSAAAAVRDEIDTLLRHGAYASMLGGEGADGGDAARSWRAQDIDTILQRSETKVVHDAAQGEAAAKGPSLFATASFVASSDDSQNVKLDDPDFWRKVMPEAAAKAEQEEAKKQSQLEQELAAEADAAATLWSWPERKRVLAALSLYGIGRWAAIADNAALNGKTEAELAAFVWHYVTHCANWAPGEQAAHLLATMHADRERGGVRAMDCDSADADADAAAAAAAAAAAEPLPPPDVCFEEPAFARMMAERAAEDIPRLAMLQVLNSAVSGAGGEDGALTERLQLPELDETASSALPPWWGAAEDRCLLVGVWRHGYGRSDRLRGDAQLTARLQAAAAAAGPPEPAPDQSTNPASAADATTAEDDVWPAARHLTLRLKRLLNAIASPAGDATAAAGRRPAPARKAAGGPRAAPAKRARKSDLPAEDAEAKAEAKRIKLLAALEAVERCKDHTPELPVSVGGGLMLESLGELQPHREGFHNASYLFPVGFRTSRMFARMDKPDEKCKYLQEVIDGGDRPLFRVTAEAGGGEPIVHQSATGVWSQILTRVRSAREAAGQTAPKTAISGPEFFGLSVPLVRALLEELPAAPRCTEYMSVLA